MNHMRIDGIAPNLVLLCLTDYRTIPNFRGTSVPEAQGPPLRLRGISPPLAPAAWAWASMSPGAGSAAKVRDESQPAGWLQPVVPVYDPSVQTYFLPSEGRSAMTLNPYNPHS